MPLCFRIEEIGSDEIIRILTRKLGENVVIRELKENGFKATGNIMLGTTPITVDEFKKILLKQGTKVKEVRLR